jgi:hypothetical protein
MVRPDKSGPDNCSLVSQIVPDSSSNPVTAPVDSRRRAHRTARDSSSRAPRRDRVHRHAPDSRNAPACQTNPACRHVQDSRRDPICRRSQACRPARANRNNGICRRNRARRKDGPD